MPKALVGYASVFFREGDAGSEYRLARDVVERVLPGAFDKSLQSAADIAALFNHNPDFVLGRRAAGTLKLSVDQRGLKYEISYNGDDPQHQTVYQKLLRGDIIGSSFSFTVRKENTRRTGGGYVRELIDVRLIEVSPVWMPAYDSTTATARDVGIVGSVRWCYDNPELVDQYDAVQARLKQIERQQVKDRLRELELTH